MSHGVVDNEQRPMWQRIAERPERGGEILLDPDYLIQGSRTRLELCVRGPLRVRDHEEPNKKGRGIS